MRNYFEKNNVTYRNVLTTMNHTAYINVFITFLLYKMFELVFQEQHYTSITLIINPEQERRIKCTSHLLKFFIERFIFVHFTWGFIGAVCITSEMKLSRGKRKLSELLVFNTYLELHCFTVGVYVEKKSWLQISISSILGFFFP